MEFFYHYLVLLMYIYKYAGGTQWHGRPQVQNCESNLKRAKSFKIQTNVRVEMVPRWSNWTENHLFKDLVFINYTWTWSMVQLDDKKKEHPVRISNWITRGGAAVVIPPYGVKPGLYKLNAKAKALSPTLPNKQSVCYLFYQARAPIVLISGGAKQTVPADSELNLSGEDSFDTNARTTSNEGLIYHWTCTQKKPSTFCKKSPLSTKATMTIPAKYVEAGDVIEVSLKVTTPSDNRGTFVNSNTFIQTITVLKNAARIVLTCEKNCPPASHGSNYQFLTFLNAKCLDKCSEIKDADYEWTVEPVESSFTFDYDKHTQFGRHTYKFVIKQDVFKPGKYKVIVRLKNTAPRVGEAEIVLNYPGPPSVKRCSIVPTKGDSLTTPFSLFCEQSNPLEVNYYELYAVAKSAAASDSSKYELILDGFYPKVLDTKFMLPPSSDYTYFVKVTNEDGPPKELKVAAHVTAGLRKEKTEVFVKDFKKMYDGGASGGLVAKITEGSDEERAEAFHQLRNLVEEVVNKKFKDKDLSEFVQELKFDIVEDMLNAPTDSVNEVLKMSSAISKLVSHDDLKENDPLLGKFTTTICKKMMNKHFELVKEDKFPLNLAEKTNKMSNTLVKCLETNTNPNYNIVKPIEYNITTEAPIDDEQLITENYDNYEDFDENYYKNLDYLKESTYNIISATAQSAKVLAFTTVIGEKFVKTSGSKSATVVAKDYGYELAKIEMKSYGVTLIPPQDFANDDHPYDILMSTWKKDIMWWNPAKTHIYTDILNVEIWHSTCKERVRSFTKPAQLFFNLRKDKDFKVKHEIGTFTVPAGYQSLSGEKLDRTIKVRRIGVPKGKALYIEFANISSSLNVAITIFKFPCEEDFGNATTLKPGSTSTLGCTNQEDYDIWCYVGVLADKAVTASSVTYTTSYITTYCVTWKVQSSSWEYACKPGKKGNTSVINCECDKFSVFAGHIENFKSELQEVDEPELELTLVSCYVVFITLVVTFGLYCFLAICAIVRQRREIYFLSDNSSKDRFAYIIVIKTGSGRNAGTTSNVIIRLVGSQHSSKPHVLNYPDPKLNLLQKSNKDMFILTTEQHLGDIEKIELWFDCIGPSPDWYCYDILVYDMQSLREWYFKVKKRLAVIKGDIYFALSPIKKANVSKRRCSVKCKFSNRYHTWYLWQKESTFGYMKKLTVILSTILLTYVMTLIFYGVPILELKDGLDRFSYEIDTYSVFVAFTGSFPSFMLHIAIAWCFRFSKNQYHKDQEGRRMPFCFTLTCWMLLIFLICICIMFLLIFGFWLPFNKSMTWLISCAIGIGFGVFVYESVFVFLANLICRMELTFIISKKFTDIWGATEAQRWYLYKQFGDLLLRPYFQHLYRPIEKVAVLEKKMIVERRRYVISELEDLVMFGIYIVILYIVVLANKDHLIVHSKSMMEEVVAGVHTRSMGFSDIQSSPNVYDFINETLIMVLQPSHWYGNYVISDPGLMIDVNNKYIGVARLRQVRIKKRHCKPPEQLKFLKLTCRPEFTINLVETKTFGYGWGKFTPFLKFDRLRRIWRYARERQTGSFVTVGEIATYSGGGYLAFLGRTLYNSIANFRKLLQKFWIDLGTRSIFIEFLTYNANYNVFNSIRLLYEQSASGYTYKTVDVDAVRMLFVQNEVEKITIIFFFMFVTWVGMLFFKQSLGVIKKIKTFYKDVWFLIDFIIISMSVSTIALFILRMKMIGIYLKRLETMKHNEFLNYFYLFYLEDFLKILAAVLVCIATVRLWKFLRFGLMFRVLERTLAVSVLPLLTFTIAYIILLMSFALPLVFLCGNHMEKIDTIIRMLRLMFTMAMKAGEMDMSHYLQHKDSIFYIVLYAFLVKINFLIYIMIIMMGYSEAQLEFSTEVEGYTIKHYVQERVHYFPKFVKYKYQRKRLRAGDEQTLKVETKSDKFVYSNCFSVESTRMTTMEYITKCIFRNMKTVKTTLLTDKDIQLMAGLSGQLLMKTKREEVEVFYKGRVRGKKIALIDEKKVLKVARAANLLLQKKEEKRTKIEAAKTRAMYEYDKCVKMIKKNQGTLKRCDVGLKIILQKIISVEMRLKQIK